MSHDLQSLKTCLVGLGTTQIAHLDGTLLAHMENVYRIIGQLERPEHVMLGGLFHGVYGTHALHSTNAFVLAEGRRAQIRELVGEGCERLVYNFCVMTYESLGKSFRNVLRKGGQPELIDRCTGLQLDISRADLDDLLWLKLADLLAHVPQLSNDLKSMVAQQYGPFWQLVAEHLGPAAVAQWNAVLGDIARISPRDRRVLG